MPASAAVRTGFVSATALTLALLAGSPALADEGAPVQLNEECTETSVLAEGLSCIDGYAVPTPVPDPSPVVEEPGPPVVVEPPPDPLPVDPPPPVVVDPLPVEELPPVGQNPPPDALPDPGPVPAPNGPARPVPGGSLSEKAEDAEKPAAAPATEVAPGRSLLAVATASTLASSDLPTLAAMKAAPALRPGSAGAPLSAFMPSPLLANMPPNAALAAVQAPLLAAGDDAAAGGGFTLAGLDSKALPGLLVVLATALVAAVGAGNMRAWQERLPQWRRAYARPRR